MNEVGDLELNVLSCLLIKPELMKELILEDKHFIKHQRTWQFMKACYKKFGTLDIQLMYSICSNKYHLIEYLIQIIDIEPTYENFELYQKALIEQFDEKKKEKYIIENIYQLANDLYVRSINLTEFHKRLDNIYKLSDKLF